MLFLFFTDDYGGHGNSFHGTGGRGNKRAQMRYCIRLLRSVCSQGDEQVLADLSDQNTIAELVGMLFILLKKNVLSFK